MAVPHKDQDLTDTVGGSWSSHACNTMPFMQQLTNVFAPQDPGHNPAIYTSTCGLPELLPHSDASGGDTFQEEGPSDIERSTLPVPSPALHPQTPPQGAARPDTAGYQKPQLLPRAPWLSTGPSHIVGQGHRAQLDAFTIGEGRAELPALPAPHTS